MRQFETGATRDTDEGKLDFEGFLSHDVLVRFAQYMNRNRIQADGKLRDSDNWQKGIPRDAYMKSAWRHFMDWWSGHRKQDDPDLLQDSLCAVMFNVMGYLHEELKTEPESYLMTERTTIQVADDDGNIRQFVEIGPDEIIIEDDGNLYEQLSRALSKGKSYGLSRDHLTKMIARLMSKEEWE